MSNIQQSKIPAFASLEEAAAFWDTHDSSEFEDEWEPVDVEISPNLTSWRTFSVRIEYAAFAQMRTIAQQQGISAPELARVWLLDALARATSKDKGGDPKPTSNAD